MYYMNRTSQSQAQHLRNKLCADSAIGLLGGDNMPADTPTKSICRKNPCFTKYQNPYQNRPPPSFPSAGDENGRGQKESKALETKGEAKKEEQIGTAAAAVAIPNSASRHLWRIRSAMYPATQQAGVWGKRERKRTWIRGRRVVRSVAAGGSCS